MLEKDENLEEVFETVKGRGKRQKHSSTRTKVFLWSAEVTLISNHKIIVYSKNE